MLLSERGLPHPEPERWLAILTTRGKRATGRGRGVGGGRQAGPFAVVAQLMVGESFRELCATSTSWLATAEVPRLFHRAGARVTLLGPPDAWPLRGSFVDGWVPARGDQHQIAAALAEHLRSVCYDWIVLGDDPLLAAVRARAGEDWTRAVLPVAPHPDKLDLLGSKVGFVRAAEALGLPIPRSRVCAGADQTRATIRAWGIPVMLKQDGPSGGEGCHALATAGAVDALPHALFDQPVVVQALVPGSTVAVEAIYDRGRLRHAVTSTVLRAWPAPFGGSAVRRFADDRALVALAEDIGTRVAPHGFANITAVRAPHGTLYLIELDLRPNALFHLGQALGVDVAPTLRAILERAPAGPPRRLAPGVNVTVPVYPTDLLRCLGERDWRGLGAWAVNHQDRWRWLPQGDPRMRRALGAYVLRRVARVRPRHGSPLV